MKKLLLISLTILMSSLTSYGQVPVNDLFNDATEINSFPFSDTNVRLDLATSSGIATPGCNLSSFNLVYYKFIATNTASSQLTVSIEDTSAGNINSSFAIVFSAPSLTINDESELTNVISTCAYSISTTIDLINGTSYYILVNRSDANALSTISFEVNEIPPVSTSERDALVALYNSTNGDQWINNSLWNTDQPVGSWYGVDTVVINNITYVSSISIGSNNLTGTLPSEIGNFPQLTYLGLWANQITGPVPPEIGNLTNLVELDMSPNSFSGSIPPEIGNLINLEILWLNQNGLTGTIPTSFQNLVNLRQLYLIGAVGTGSTQWTDSSYSGDFPDLTALPLELLRMENNFFHFDDIADEFATYQANIPNFIFNPQFTVDPPEDVASDVGDDITLTLTEVSDTGRMNMSYLAGNQYQWLKDDTEISGANGSTYTIFNAQASDSGVYSCEITNPDVPGFIVTRSGITLTVGTLGIETPDLNDIRMYPNPVSDVLTLEIPDLSPVNIALYDMKGRVIITHSLEAGITNLPMNKIASGLYLLRVETETASVTRQIIKK